MTASILAFALLAAPAAPPAASTTPFDRIVATERAFAALSPKEGFHAAFVAYFAEDGVVFDPTPTNGRAKHQGKPAPKGVLSWAPGWAAVARAGDIGFTSGPWEYREPGEKAPPPATGWFFTAWRRQADGSYKVEADLGVDAKLDYAPPAQVVDAMPAPDSSRPARPSDAAAARAQVAAAEHKLEAAGEQGLGAAISAAADSALRVYRDGALPADGAAAAGPVLSADTRKASCRAARVAAASSGDLGYAYGTCTPSGGDASKGFGFLRVWRRQGNGTWKVLVDVTP